MSMVIDDGMTDEQREAHHASTKKAMEAAGVPTEEYLYEDYFDTTVEHKVMLPDGKQFIVHTELNEGARRKYLNGQNRDVVVERQSGNARMKMSPGDERHALLEAAITDWSVVRGAEHTPMPFTQGNLRTFLEKAPPRVIDLIEKDVRKHNAWLLQEMSVEDIEKEIESLEEMKQAKIKEDLGNASS